ncbi:MAG: hypothetical protein ACRDRT_17445, partial [Pseudonocardiaceae bacterium]
MCLGVVRAAALTVVLIGFVLITGVVVFAGRCAAAAWAYIASTDGDDIDITSVLTSDQFLDFEEKSYWMWGLLLALVMWSTLFFIILVIWWFRWAVVVVFWWLCCDLPCYKHSFYQSEVPEEGGRNRVYRPPPVSYVEMDGVVY